MNIQDIFYDIANAIRYRKNTSQQYSPYEFANAINSIYIDNTAINGCKDYLTFMNDTHSSNYEYIQYIYGVTPARMVENPERFADVLTPSNYSYESPWLNNLYIGNNVTNLQGPHRSYIRTNNYILNVYFGDNQCGDDAHNGNTAELLNLYKTFANMGYSSYETPLSVQFFANDYLNLNSLVSTFSYTDTAQTTFRGFFNCNQDIKVSSAGSMFSGTSFGSVSINNLYTNSTARMFYSCGALTSVENLNVIDTSGGNPSYGSMFYQCALFNSPINLSMIEPDGATNPYLILNLNALLYNAQRFNSQLNIDIDIHSPLYICSNTTFFNCTNFNRVDGVFNEYPLLYAVSMFKNSKFNISTDFYFENLDTNLSNASYMFSDCQSLNTIINLHGNLYDASHMFANCRSFDKQINFDSINIAYTNDMFYDCINLNQFTLKNINMQYYSNSMFYNCTNLKNITLNNVSINQAGYMFFNCSNLNEIYIEENVSINNAQYMFGNCNAFISTNLNNINIDYGQFMFYNCNSLDSINITDVTIHQNANQIFNNCNNLNNINIINSSINNYLTFPAYIKNLNIINSNIFASVSSLNKNFNLYIEDSEVHSIRYLFSSSTYNRPIQIINSRINYAENAFNNCRSFYSDINIIDSHIDNAAYMFTNCNIFNRQINFINTTINNAYGMFWNCIRLNQPLNINIPILNTASMFLNCNYLRSVNIYMSENLQGSSYMFANCNYYFNCNMFFPNGLLHSSALSSMAINAIKGTGWLKIYCNDLTPFRNSDNRMLGSNTITWTTTTNGYYNTAKRIYLYNNCP